MVTKDELRKVYLEKRSFLSDSEYKTRNRRVRKNIAAHFSSRPPASVHIFLPITEKKEVNTWPIIHDLRKNHPRCVIYTSKAMKNGHLTHYLLTEETRLVVNRWGIPEPADTPEVDLRQVDSVIVPLIISDKRGNRIGYGKGYYDRFLEEVRVGEKIGITLSPSLDFIPCAEPHDVPLTCCIGPYLVDKITSV